VPQLSRGRFKFSGSSERRSALPQTFPISEKAAAVVEKVMKEKVEVRVEAVTE
jgi:hypothetical protein